MPPEPTPRLADELIRAVELIVAAFEAKTIRYALVGGLAAMLRGRPRFTSDVDFLLDVPQLALPGLLDDLVAAGFDLDPAKVIREYVRQHITAFHYGMIRIDWLKPVLPLYSRALADASGVTWPADRPLKVATPEGLILTKLVAYRPQDLEDIKVLLAANRDTIDLNLIRDEWATAVGDEARTVWFEAAVARFVPSPRP